MAIAGSAAAVHLMVRDESRVNFNDGTAGGEVLEMNLVMNFVRESGDHGMFNSWQVILSYNAQW